MKNISMIALAVILTTSTLCAGKASDKPILDFNFSGNASVTHKFIKNDVISGIFGKTCYSKIQFAEGEWYRILSEEDFDFVLDGKCEELSSAVQGIDKTAFTPSLYSELANAVLIYKQDLMNEILTMADKIRDEYQDKYPSEKKVAFMMVMKAPVRIQSSITSPEMCTTKADITQGSDAGEEMEDLSMIVMNKVVFQSEKWWPSLENCKLGYNKLKKVMNSANLEKKVVTLIKVLGKEWAEEILKEKE
ncbi:hypothetical protein ACFL6Y_00935 [Elusimicrobiota bacterium]